MKRLTITLALVLLLALLSVGRANANSAVCSDLFYSEAKLAVPKADLRTQVALGYVSQNVEAYKRVEALRALAPGLRENQPLDRAITRLIEDESLSTFHKLLGNVVNITEVRLRAMGSDITNDPKEVTRVLRTTLKAHLLSFMPERMATKRSALIASPKIDKFMLMKALGQLSAKESLEVLVGPGGIKNVSPDSLVGRYLKEAQKEGALVETYVGKFKKGPDYPDQRGEEKLFITVTPSSQTAADMILGQNPHFLIHTHDPYQGTLYMRHDGQRASYSAYAYPTPLSMQHNSIYPLFVLSSTEASNVKNYFDLGQTDRGRAKYPWGLRKLVDGKEKSAYCRVGGYASCTHWIGEMPIGDKLVSQLKVPGQGQDRYSNANDTMDPKATDQTAIRKSKVGTYTHFQSQSDTYEVGVSNRADRLTRMVWTEGKSHEQLWSMIGKEGEDALAKGEFANPGWVLYSLLSRSNSDRVPVVLVYRESHDNSAFDQAYIDNLTFSISPQ